MKTSNRLILKLCAVLLVGVSVSATANKVDKLKITTPSGFNGAPEIEVYSTNGERWTDVDRTDMSKFRVGLNAECKYEGRGNKAYRGKLIVPGFASAGSEEPANFLIPHSKEASGVFRWDGGSGQNLDPVKACNDELKKRQAQNPNKSKYHILAEGFRVNYPAAFAVQYRLTCKPTGAGFTDSASRNVTVNARIKCGASALAESKIPSEKPKSKPPKRAKVVPLIKRASFEADPEVHVGSCPVGIAFNGSITATRAGTVKYQYMRKDGKKSPKFSLVFNKAGTQKTRAWHTTVSRPDASKTLSSGSGSSGDIQGWYRMDILSPAPKGRFVAHYRVDCDGDKPLPARAKKIEVQPVEKKIVKPIRKVNK